MSSNSAKTSTTGEDRTEKCTLEPSLDLESKTPLKTSFSAQERARHDSTSKREPCSIGDGDGIQTQPTNIKRESGISCVLCSGGTDDAFDIYCETTCGDVTLCSYICKVASLNLDHRACSKYACRTCFELLNLIERAELEYLKHRDLLLDIISHNPALAGLGAYNTLEAGFPRTISIEYLKPEPCKSECRVSSEDDEPLANIKASRTRSKQATLIAEPSKLDDGRHFSSDDDFNWKLETEEDCLWNKTNSKQRPKVKDKVGQKNSHLLKPYERNARTNGLAKNKLRKTTKLKNFENKKNSGSEPSSSGTNNADLKCTKCNRIFKKKCYLERHSHCKKPYICEICGKGFKSPKLCNAHVLMHQGIADYKCIPCNKLFPTKVAFLRHDKIHNGMPNNQCDLCGKSFIHQSSLRMHKLAHAGVRRHTCDVCGLALLSNSMLTRHKLVHTGEKNFACQVCGKKFARNSNMQTHMKTHTKDKPRPPTPPDVPGKRKKVFRCEMCPERFDRLFKLEIHLVDDHKVVLKKGRPKPRNTMKKLQRAQQAAATVVNAITTAMSAKRGLIATSSKSDVDIKPSVSKLNEKMKEVTGPDAAVFKTSPHHQSMSPAAASYMSPPPAATYARESSEPERMEYHDHQQLIRSTGVMMPPMAFNVGAEYLSRMPDYSHH